MKKQMSQVEAECEKVKSLKEKAEGDLQSKQDEYNKLLESQKAAEGEGGEKPTDEGTGAEGEGAEAEAIEKTEEEIAIEKAQEAVQKVVDELQTKEKDVATANKELRMADAEARVCTLEQVAKQCINLDSWCH